MSPEQGAAQRVHTERLLGIHAVATRFYRAQLAADDGSGPSRFLARLGVPVDGRWAVGFAPDRPTGLVNELRRHGFSDVEIRASGLAATSHFEQLADRFRNRVMIGVRDGPDSDAPVVGFAGYAPPRSAPDVAPCVISPGTAIFRPKSVLFGLAEQGARVGQDTIVAPDPLQVIAIADSQDRGGPPSLVVAPGGASLSGGHVRRLKELADPDGGVAIFVRPDPDGRRRAERTYKLLTPTFERSQLFVADRNGQVDRSRSFVEALVVSHVDWAADAELTDAAREAAERSAHAMLTGHDAEVAERLRNYIGRRLGAGVEAPPPPTLAPGRTERAPRERATGPPNLPKPPASEQMVLGLGGGDAGVEAPETRPARAPDAEPQAPESDGPLATPPAERILDAPAPAKPAPSEPAPAERTPAEPAPAESTGPRFRPSGQQDLAPSGERARIEANLAAIRALHAQTADGRPPTLEEQALYARWSGWGATPELFDERPGFRERYASERAELQELLGDQAYRSARATTLNAHYTDAAYVQAIWSAVRELGFTDGRFLEPGCGSGNFISLAPEDAQAVGVELDPTTAAMAQALHPDAQIRAESFADSRFAANGFDLAIGNVPFGQHKLLDPEHNPGRRQPIHNHFILKSLQFTRPGGLVAVITSRHTMDGTDDAHVEARVRMGELADLVGAVRLPNDAHKAAAGTHVVTDLLLLRRRGAEASRDGPSWLGVRPAEYPAAREGVGPESFEVNEYFVDHPDMVLGQSLTNIGRHGPELTVRADGAVAPALEGALGQIVAYAREHGLTMSAPEVSPDDRATELNGPSELQEGVFADLGDGRFTRVSDGRALPHYPPKTQAAELAALIGMRDTVLALLDEEATHREDTWRMNELRVDLNARYDRYVGTYGPINRFKSSTSTRTDKSTGETVETERRAYPRLGGFRDDPFWPYVSALEKFDEETLEAGKADIFGQRVVAVPVPVDRAQSPDDALVIAWDRHNEVRLDEVARLLDLETDEEARQALGTLVYDEPGSGALIRRSEYLSGNARRKLAAAEQAAVDDPRFAVNVKALRAIVPRDLTPGEIGARLGSPWIDAAYVQQFLQEILEDSSIKVSNVGATWSVRGGSKHGVLHSTVWGTAKRPAQSLAESLLNSKPIEVSKEGVKDAEATAFAQAKAQQLDERFRAWMWEDPQRAEALGRVYNDRFNSFVPQSFDGEFVSAPGRSAAAFDLRPHQMAAVARIRNTPGAGLFHGTGAGKTLEMIVGGMELVRLGLAKKPAYVVPKAVVGQFQREFLQTYPRARVLAVDSEDLTGEKRRQFVARCSTGNWDAVIISHNAFKKIPVSRRVQVEYLERQKERLEGHLANADDAEKHTVKDIEKQLESLAARIDEVLAQPTDPGVEFERTGIGYLFVDEAHVYKNLMVISSIPELAHQGNQITADLDMKLGYLRETYGKRVVTLATATPIDNSPSEILTMTKYATPELLEEMGIVEDDQFHATFIQPRRRLEMKPDGSRFESRTRHARFVNVPELKKLMYSWADVKLKKDLALGEPSIVGGQEEILSVPAATELRWFLKDLGERAMQLKGFQSPERLTASGEWKRDNILWVSNDGRMASLDLRMVGLSTSEPQKVDVLADRVAEIWRKHRDDVYYEADGTPEPVRGSLQLVFCDLGVPGNGRWSFYEALRDELVQRGMPREQVRFAQEAKNRRQKDQLQREAREGKIAVLMGSRAGLGTGVNIQRRVVAVIQADPTWKLTPIEQSLGRGKRQGNMNSEIHHIFVVTEGSYDPFLWQKVDDKRRFTEQMLDPNDTTRSIDAQSEDDGAQINPSIMFAVGAGRPELLELHTLEELVNTLKLEQRIWHSEQFTLDATISQGRRSITDIKGTIELVDAALERRRDTRGDAFVMTVGDQQFDSRPEAGAALLQTLARAQTDTLGVHTRRVRLGELGNFPVVAHLSRERGQVTGVLGIEGVPGERGLEVRSLVGQDPTGLVRKLENRLTGLEGDREACLTHIEKLEANIGRAEARVGQPFPRQEELEEATAKFEQLEKTLAEVTDKDVERDEAAGTTSGGPPVRLAQRRSAAGVASRDRPTPAPVDVIRELRPSLEPHREPIGMLEALALTDSNLLAEARGESIRDFAQIASHTIGHLEYGLWAGDEAAMAEFHAVYERTRGEVDSYLIARLWLHANAEEPAPAREHGVDPLAPYRDALGPVHSSAIEAQARKLVADNPERDEAEWHKELDRGRAAFEELNLEVAREARSIEVRKRQAIEAAAEALASAQALEEQGTPGAAAAQRTLAEECQQQLTGLLNEEWQLEQADGNPTDWLAKSGERAARFVAAELALGPEVEVDASRDLRAQLQPFRWAVVQLEAEIVTDRSVINAARVNALDNVTWAANRWIPEAIAARGVDLDGWEPEFIAAYFAEAGTVNQVVDNYLIARVWEEHGAKAAHDEGTPDRPIDALAPWREALGEPRCALIEARAAAHAQEHADRDRGSWEVERACSLRVFDGFNRVLARKTLRLESDMRVAIETALDATAAAEAYESQRDPSAAEVQRGIVTDSRAKLAELIAQEWQLFEAETHLSAWTSENAHAAAVFVAAEWALAPDQEIAVDPVAAQEPTGQARHPDLDVGMP